MNHVKLRALALNGSRIQSATAVPPRDRFIMMQQKKTLNEEGETQKRKDALVLCVCNEVCMVETLPNQPPTTDPELRPGRSEVYSHLKFRSFSASRFWVD